MQEIDRLIQEAPDTPPPVNMSAHRLNRQEAWAEYDLDRRAQLDALLHNIVQPYHAADKVHIDGYDLLNNKTSLRAFKKASRRRLTSKPIGTPTPTVKPTGKRVTDFDGDYCRPYVPCKVVRLTERPQDCDTAGMYHAGFFTNGAYMVFTAKPKTKRPITDPYPDAGEFIDRAMAGDMLSAVIGAELYVEGCEPWVKIHSMIGVFKINAVYLDIIMKHHPTAEAHTGADSGVVYFMKGETLVGCVMRLRG